MTTRYLKDVLALSDEAGSLRETARQLEAYSYSNQMNEMRWTLNKRADACERYIEKQVWW
jgi:hypothetical protein